MANGMSSFGTIWSCRHSNNRPMDQFKVVNLKRLSRRAFACSVLLISAATANGQTLYQIPAGVSTRWASPENRQARVGQGGQANGGRKGSAFVPLKANEQLVLAESHGVSGTVRRIWLTISD